MTDRDDLIRESRDFANGITPGLDGRQERLISFVLLLANALEASLTPPVSLDGGSPEMTSLRTFARWAIEDSREYGTIDGFDVQDYAAHLGLLVRTPVTEACDPDHCACAEFGFPSECYRFSPVLAAKSSIPPSVGGSVRT